MSQTVTYTIDPVHSTAGAASLTVRTVPPVNVGALGAWLVAEPRLSSAPSSVASNRRPLANTGDAREMAGSAVDQTDAPVAVFRMRSVVSTVEVTTA